MKWHAPLPSLKFTHRHDDMTWQLGIVFYAGSLFDRQVLLAAWVGYHMLKVLITWPERSTP